MGTIHRVEIWGSFGEVLGQFWGVSVREEILLREIRNGDRLRSKGLLWYFCPYFLQFAESENIVYLRMNWVCSSISVSINWHYVFINIEFHQIVKWWGNEFGHSFSFVALKNSVVRAAGVWAEPRQLHYREEKETESEINKEAKGFCDIFGRTFAQLILLCNNSAQMIFVSIE